MCELVLSLSQLKSSRRLIASLLEAAKPAIVEHATLERILGKYLILAKPVG